MDRFSDPQKLGNDFSFINVKLTHLAYVPFPKYWFIVPRELSLGGIISTPDPFKAVHL